MRPSADPLPRFLRIHASGLVAAAALLCTTAPALAHATLPPGKVVDAVYCDRGNRNCQDVFGSRAFRVKRAPRGYDRRRRCTWFDSGYSRSLAVDKHYCVRKGKR